MAGPVIRYGGCIFGPEEITAVTRVLMSGNWACGEVTAEFEQAAARRQGRQYALFVNSGSSALLLGMAALPPGSRVAMPALQFATLYSAAVRMGHTPVLVDIDDSLNMDPLKLEALREGQVNAVAFVHMAGNPTNAYEVASICKGRGWPLLEDVCEALGSRSGRTLAGNFGLVSATSTHGAHHISTGEGGLVFTDDWQACLKMKRLRDWGRAYGGGDELDGYYPGYVFSELGFNLHATDIQAALGLVQLEKLDMFIRQRRANWVALAYRTAGLPFVRPTVNYLCHPSWFTFALRLNSDRRDKLIEHLRADGIESRPVVAGNMARQPLVPAGRPGDYPVADEWFRRGLWVSVHPQLGEPELKRISDSLHRFWGG